MIIVFFYIDDIVVLNRKKNKTITKEFKTDLYQRYNLKDKGELK
jgi:predicted GNAT superfamily acetyltransferase